MRIVFRRQGSAVAELHVKGKVAIDHQGVLHIDNQRAATRSPSGFWFGEVGALGVPERFNSFEVLP